MPFEKLNHATLEKQVVRAIRRQIFNGDLPANARIVEAEIAREMGISRAPVREALGILQREGLIVTYPRKGSYVVDLTYADIEEIYTLRVLLECHAVGLAMERLTGADLARLRDLVEQIGAAAGSDVLEAARCDMLFHDEIFKLSGHKRLCQAWKDLAAQMQMLMAMTKEFFLTSRDLRQVHAVLVDALAAGDRRLARESFEHHIMNGIQDLIAALKRIRGQKEPSPAAGPAALTGSRAG